jgi:hypothetical protein
LGIRKTRRKRVVADTSGQKAVLTMAIGRTIRWKAMVFSLRLTALSYKESLKIITSTMVQGYT